MSENGPSNFVVFALIVVAIVLLWFAWLTTHRHRSPDQEILLRKSHQN